jgi:hypothetical protein
MEFSLDKKYEDDIRYIQHLLVEDFTDIIRFFRFTDFSLPTNYFELSNTLQKLQRRVQRSETRSFEIKKIRILFLEMSSTNLPLKYREAPTPSLQVRSSTQNFTVDSISLHYRKPLK